MTSSLEQFSLAGLALNDGVNFTLESLVFTPAAKKPLWASNASADGDALVQESHYSNATFDLQIRVGPAASTDAAFILLGQLQDALQAAERAEGGVETPWTPANSPRTYTAYTTLAEMSELPVTPTGELAGWFIKSPVIKVKLTCRPFLYTEEKVVKAATESAAEPLQVLYAACGGDVPAEARLKVTDKASQSRRYAEFGRELVASEAGNPAVLLTAANLVVTNFSGSSTTRSGAFSEEKVKRATAVSQATTMCGTGLIKNVGSYRVYARVFTGSEQARFRMAYRNGEGPLIPIANPGFVQPSVLEFARIFLGEITLDKALLGEQKAELRVEVKSANGEPIEVDLNYLELIPSTKGSARARGQANNSPTKLLAYDTFLQAEANLDAPVAMPLGGNWAEASKTGAAGFKVIAANHWAERTAKEDGLLTTGSFALAGTEEPTTSKVSVELWSSKVWQGLSVFRRGVFLRYVDTSNWLMAYITSFSGVPYYYLALTRTVATVPTTILKQLPTEFSQPSAHMIVSLQADAAGIFRAWCYLAGGSAEPAPLTEGQSSVLATGGTLAKGKGGFYDAYTGAEAGIPRVFDNFSLLAGEPANVVLYSGKTGEIRSDGYQRQDESGTYYGEIPQRGAQLYLDPMGVSILETNLVPNPNFEVNTAKWVGGAGGFRTNTGATLTRDTGQHQDGVAAAKLVTPGVKSSEGLDLEQVLPVVSGITYRISAYVKGNAGGESLQLVVGDAAVGSATKSFVATTGFQRIDVSLTAAASGNTGVAVRTNGTAAVTFWVDAVLWEKSEALNPYFPTAAQLEAGIATWTGASNESASNLLSGPGGRINRLVVVARRNDVEVEADANVTDKHQIEVLARERFLAPR